MRFIGIAVIDGKMFRNAEVDAPDQDSAEKEIYAILRKRYIGQINIIKVEVLSEWEKKVKYERSR